MMKVLTSFAVLFILCFSILSCATIPPNCIPYKRSVPVTFKINKNEPQNFKTEVNSAVEYINKKFNKTLILIEETDTIYIVELDKVNAIMSENIKEIGKLGYTSYSTVLDVIIDADVVIDLNKTQNRGKLLHNVIIHELLHALGYTNHSEQDHSIMNARLFDGNQHLTKEDIEKIKCRYGNN